MMLEQAANAPATATATATANDKDDDKDGGASWSRLSSPCTAFTPLRTSRVQIEAEETNSFVSSRRSHLPSYTTSLDDTNGSDGMLGGPKSFCSVLSQDQEALALLQHNLGKEYLKTRKTTWYWYIRVRRWFEWIPGLANHGNSFLCDQMLSVTVRILTVFVLRMLFDEVLLVSHQLSTDGNEFVCTEFTKMNLIYCSATLPIPLILCLPALTFSKCELFKANTESTMCAPKAPSPHNIHANPSTTSNPSNASHEIKTCPTKAYEKTYLLTLCEVVVILEIPLLIYVGIASVLLHNGLDVLYHCAWHVAGGIWYHMAFLFSLVLSGYEYFLRWQNVLVFHRLHEHLLFQRGFWRGNNRFDFDGTNALDVWRSCWNQYHRRILEAKVLLYQAAKEGKVHELEHAYELAQTIDGPDFASKWYQSEASGTSGFGSNFRAWLRVYRPCQRNPLHVAVAFGQLECVRFLVQQAHVEVNGFDTIELVHMDISSFYRRVFDFFLFFIKKHHSSRLQHRAIFGSSGTLLTPLHVAISLGNHEMAALLIHLGADGNICAWSRHRRFRTPPLFWAVSEECAELLLLEADVNHLHVPCHGYYLTAYEIARMAGNHSMADRLQLFGGDMALTPLHNACAKGDLEEVRFYLDHGANPNSLGENCVGFFGRTPLQWASMRGHQEVVKLLIEYGACVDFCDRFGRTPLAWACFFRRVSCIQVLLEAGADPNAIDAFGYPILSICASSPVAARIHRHELASRLETEESAASSSRASDRLLHCFLKMLSLWKIHHGELNLTSHLTGDTPLHVALMNNNEQAAIAFVRNGMSLTAVNHAGTRAIDCTNSTAIRYALKKEAGYRDVMISYCHRHAHFAWKIRNALERAHITTWIDQMDPTGITGGSIWRREIAKAIERSSMMICILCEHYPRSQWCMKELAYAKVTDTPVLAIQCSEVEMNDELQMYLYTRQIIDFKETILGVQSTPNTASLSRYGSGLDPDRHESVSNVSSSCSDGGVAMAMQQIDCWFQYDERGFDNQFKLLLDGIHAEMQKRRTKTRMRANYPGIFETRYVRDCQQYDDMDAAIQASGVNAGGCHRESTETVLEIMEPEADHSHSMMRAFTNVDLPKLMELTEHNQHEKLQILISNGDYHLEFCRRLKKQLLDSTKCNVHVEIDRPSLTSKKHLVECDVLIIVLSPKTMQSAHVADQLAFAEDHLKPILPIVLSLVEVDAAKRYTFSRSSSQILFFNESLGFSQSMESLETSIQQLSERKHEQIEAARCQEQTQEPDAELLHELTEQAMEEFMGGAVGFHKAAFHPIESNKSPHGGGDRGSSSHSPTPMVFGHGCSPVRSKDDRNRHRHGYGYGFMPTVRGAKARRGRRQMQWEHVATKRRFQDSSSNNNSPRSMVDVSPSRCFGNTGK